jgi:hypothetical protein
LLCDVAAKLSDGVLDVSGGHFDDSIALVYNQADQSIEVRGESHTVASFPIDEISSVRIRALEGNDEIGIDPKLELPTVIDGGSGTDTVVGINGIDNVFDQTIMDRFQCLGVECFDGTGADAIVTTSNHEEDEHDVMHRSDVARVLASVHEHLIESAAPVVLGRLMAPQVTLGAGHTGHLLTSQRLNGIGQDLGLPTHSVSGRLSADVEQAIATVQEVGEAAGSHEIRDSGDEEHGVAAHLLPGVTEAARVAASNPEFATRSPYSTECPSSSPVGIPAVASASSPTTVGGEIANTVTGAPKVGCKCIAMQRAAKSEQPPLARVTANEEVRQTVPTAEIRLEEPPVEESVPSCCRKMEAEELIEIDDTLGTDGDRAGELTAPVNATDGAECMTTWQRTVVAAGLALSGIALHFQHRKSSRIYVAQQLNGS